LVGPAIFVVALALGSLPAAAQSTTTSSGCSGFKFELANPSPGSMLQPGGYVLEGIAMDTRSTSGPGIDRVDFFLGNRDEGGLSLGSVLPSSTATGPFGEGSFQTTLQLPDMMGGHDLVGYAHSTVTGQEVVISVPIIVGVQEDTIVAGAHSTPTTVPTETETCTPAPAGQVTTPPAVIAPATAPTTTTTTPSTSTTTTTPATSVAASNASIRLNIANPDPGASIFSGGFEIEGTAWDTMAQQGVGVDRVEVFLDNRDEGGMLLSTAIVGMTNPAATGTNQPSTNTWRTIIDLPANQTGPHSLWFYAHSSVTGLEKAVEVPVSIVQ
jgi:hypothetical protein